MDAAALKARFEEQQARTGRRITNVKVGGFDIDGVLRGKLVSLDKFWGMVESGFGFCDVVFGWDITDVLYDNAKVTGWDTGYPDAHAVVDTTTLRFPPGEPDTAAFIVDFTSADGSEHPACPRSLLKRVLARAEDQGFTASFGSEFEFWVFKETPETLHEKGFRNLKPLSPGMFGYSWLREDQHRDFVHAILDEMTAMDIEIEALHTETGPGVYEVALRYDEALRAADKAALFKTHMKALASRHGLAVTFMAKWNADLPGSSGHLHQSLWTIPKGDKDKKTNAFYDPAGEFKLSATAKSYLAGQIALMPELTALYAPTINSYKRYVPGVWAPMTAAWGPENRTCAIRAIEGGASATRLEYRQTAADINPFVAIATCLAAGLHGIEKKLDAPPAGKGDTSVGKEHASLPRTLKEATEWLKASKGAREILGDAFVDHYVITREWEVRQYERIVTEWELKRYFESI
ncbi:MAG: glutamine synthetase family protein [Labilithrix sp.]|nr:glutamine synthetase family protein [Labilithrix sp.]